MLKRLAVATAGLAIAAAPLLGLAASSPANASIVGDVTNGNGVAGYYAAPNANRLGNGDHMTGVRSSFYLRQAAENNQIDLGVELCRFQNLSSGGGAAAVVFAEWNNVTDVFDIYANHQSSTNCLGFQGGTSGATLIDHIPAGHTVQLSITVSAHHVITFVDSDQTTLTGGRTTFGGFTFGFDRAGVGANGEQGTLTTPANINVARFTKSAARDQAGWANLNRAGLTRYNVNPVVDTTNGLPSGGVLITPTTIGTGTNDGTFNLLMGQLSGV